MSQPKIHWLEHVGDTLTACGRNTGTVKKYVWLGCRFATCKPCKKKYTNWRRRMRRLGIL